MSEETFKYYMESFECLEKLKMRLGSGFPKQEYDEKCAIILEMIHEDYVKGDPLDKCY